ncbi:bacteriohemerythrin [Thalassotalea piscium]|uniref:Hemerythrin n=1 Tax=Thalassotalea piscium TaxID=1230533 RepID=A0A7X0TSJ7_9GAMM|nr:bacteriohemerythrin [Thalassotalea piscium]MBB6542191.1 hemerythrin [Thalassotalea piscium]
MKNRTKSLIYAAIIGLIIVAIFLGFLTSLTNPVSWILIIVLLIIPMLYNKKSVNKGLIEWKDEYSVGIEVIDNDHKKLLNLLNQMNTAYDYAMSESYEKAALNDLVDYTKYHFDREEQMMAEHDYPDLEAHKLQHKNMIAQVNHYVERYDKEGHECLDEISDFLTQWLINHINGTDKAYSKHLHSKGVY